MGDHRRDGESGLGVGDCRLEQLAHLESAEALMQILPRGRRTGHRDTRPAPLGHRIEALLPQCFRTGCARPAAGGVQPVELVTVPDDGEGVAADAVGVGLEHGERRRGGDGRVRCAAAVLQHLESRLGGQRLTGGDGTVVRQHGHTPGRVRVVIQVHYFAALWNEAKTAAEDDCTRRRITLPRHRLENKRAFRSLRPRGGSCLSRRVAIAAAIHGRTWRPPSILFLG